MLRRSEALGKQLDLPGRILFYGLHASTCEARGAARSKVYLTYSKVYFKLSWVACFSKIWFLIVYILRRWRIEIYVMLRSVLLLQVIIIVFFTEKQLKNYLINLKAKFSNYQFLSQRIGFRKNKSHASDKCKQRITLSNIYSWEC